MHLFFSDRNNSAFLGYTRFIFLFLILGVFNSVSADNLSTVDSLKKALVSSASNSQKISLLNQLSKELMDVDYQQSMHYSMEGLLLAQGLADTIGIMDAHFIIGQINVNYSLNYQKGIEHLLEALKLVRKTKRKKTEMSILALIGFVHNRQGDFEKAIKYYKEAISIAKKNQFTSDYINYSSYIADLFETHGVIDSAIVYYGKIYELEKQQQFLDAKPIPLLSIGKYFQLKKEYQQAEVFYNKALNQFKEAKNHRWESYTYHILADLHLEKKEYKTAIENADKGLALGEKYQLVKEILDNHHSLSIIYSSIGNYEKAYQHYKAMNVINDSVFSLERIKEIVGIQSNYEFAMQKNELELVMKEKVMNNLELKKNREILLLMSIGGFFLIILVVIFWRGYLRKQKINEVLKDRDELRELKMEEIVNQLNQELNRNKLVQNQLEVSNEELNNFMYRSSHDINSPLISIIGLTNIALQSDSESERIEVLKMINTSTSKLHKLLEEMLVATKVTHGNLKIVQVVFSEFLNEIIKELKNASYFSDVKIELLGDKNLKLNTDENLLRAILQNLIDNAIKYKNSAISNSFVKIHWEYKKDAVEITISDNGQGISMDQQAKVFEMFVRANYQSQGSGLGLYIVKKSIKKLGGEIKLESEPEIGSVFTILLPNLLIKQMEIQS